MKSETIGAATLEHWTPEEVRAARDAGEIVIVDVRTVPEFAFERIEGALLAPMAELDPKALPAQTGKRIVIHCGSGIRSRRVAEACAAAGFDRIAHLEGGFGAWKAAGLPYIATDPATGNAKRANA
jgi:rhodanese-related sulfurtransferase